MGLDRLTLVYVVGIFVAGFFAATALLLWVRQLRRRRHRNLTERTRFEAIHTNTPLADPASDARTRAIHAIESSSTVTRRLVVPLMVILVTFFVSLPFLDQIPATVFSLLVAAMTVLIGIAARPFVENAIAGLVISNSQILNIGDTVTINGHYGTVEDITITHTTIKIWDWRRFVISNSSMLNLEFVNHSLFDKNIWAHVEFYVAPDSNFVEVEKLALLSPHGSKYWNDVEPPTFWVMEMGKDAVRCWVAAWAATPADAWALTNDMRTNLARAMTTAGIRTHRTVWESVKERTPSSAHLESVR